MPKFAPAARRMTWTMTSYGLTVCCVVAALSVTKLLQPLTNGPPWFVFFVAVMISSWVAGLGPGLLAVLLSTLAVDYFFVPPLHILSLKTEYLPRLVLFGLSALLISWLSARRKRAETVLRQARDELDVRVQERTAALTRTNERLQAEIAERTRAEAALRERANLLDLTHDTVFVRDMRDVITYWNRGAEEFYGWKQEEAIGQVSHRLTQTIFAAPLEVINAELLGTDRWEGELIHTKRDGTQGVVASRWSLQRDERGAPVAILETNNDISERKRAEEAARRSEKELRDVIETTPAMIWSTLPDGGVDFINQRWQEFTGLPPQDPLGWNWEAVVHPEDWTRFLADWRAALKSGQSMEREIRVRRADGEYRWLFVRNVPLRDELGSIVRWYGTSIDIEDRKQAEERLHVAMSEQTRFAAFRAEIGMAMAHAENLREILHDCAEAMVRHLDAAFARIWTLSSDGRELELQASAGMYTHLDGSHSRIPVGQLKIGLIAQERKPHLTNDVQNDPRVNDKDWARREKMISFAGYPLFVGDRVVGVMGMFSQKPLTESALETLSLVADGIAQGIERKRAEEALRRSEKELRDLIETMPTMAFSVRPDGSNEFVSRGWQDYSGLSQEATEGDGWASTVHPDDFDGHLNKWRASLVSGEPFENEVRHRSVNGEYRWFLVRAVPVRDEQGHILKWYGALTNIEDRKRAEEELFEIKERFRLLAESSLTGIYLIQGDRLRYVNPALAKMFGYRVEEIVDRLGAMDLVHPDDRPVVAENVRRRIEGEVTEARYEFRGLRKDGSVCYVEVHGRRIEHGGKVGVLGTLLDITERKRAEEALREAQTELARVTRVLTLGEITASIAHEVNQPLAGVTTNGNAGLRWLARDPPDLAEARACLQRIVRDGNRASEVIARIRSLVKKSAPAKARLDLSDTIQEVLAIVDPAARQHRVSVRTDLAAGLPPVWGDRVQVQQVLLNLLLNGMEAMRGVTDRPRALVVRSQKEEDGAIRVAVQDAGPGIAPQDLERVFTPFYTTKPAGLGLGLAISRSIVEAHGGRLWATQSDGPGATVQFTLPAGRERAS